MKTPEERVRQLDANDIEAFQAFRREGLLSHPLAFGASPEDEEGLNKEFIVSSFNTPERSAVFGAFADRQMVGVVAVRRHGARKAHHRAQVWGMFVAPAARGRGLGRLLLATAVEQARAWSGIIQVQLSVADAAPEARHLYETFGFRIWGREPRALQWADRFADEYHLVLYFDSGTG
jgi:GNAT superfamily N-acetyltransferase